MKIPPLDTATSPTKSERPKNRVEKEPVSANGMIKRSGPVKGEGAPSDAEIRKKVWERRAGIESPALVGPKKIESRPQPFPLDNEEDAMKVANDLVETHALSKNDPNDPATHSKIKDLLSTGGFNFNEKEKSALGNILKTTGA